MRLDLDVSDQLPEEMPVFDRRAIFQQACLQRLELRGLDAQLLAFEQELIRADNETQPQMDFITEAQFASQQVSGDPLGESSNNSQQLALKPGIGTPVLG